MPVDHVGDPVLSALQYRNQALLLIAILFVCCARLGELTASFDETIDQ